MKGSVLILVLVLGGFALAQFSPPAGSGTTSGITEVATVYGTAGDGTGIVTNEFTFVDGVCTDFP